MSIPEILSQYGYVGVFIGTLMEGETVLLLAGFAANQGYLALPLVIGIAFVGGTLGDQIAFFLGRRYGNRLIHRYPRLAAHKPRIDRLIHRHQAPLIMGVRFLYGMRIAGPILIGTSHVKVWRFVIFNMIGAAIWATLITALGYLFGETIQVVLKDIHAYEKTLLVGVIGAVLLLTVARWLYGRWRG